MTFDELVESVEDDNCTLHPRGTTAMYFRGNEVRTNYSTQKPVYLDKEGFIHRIGGPAYI